MTSEIDADGGLFGRRSVLGGLLVLGVLTFFSTGLTTIDHLARQSDSFAVGEAVVVGSGVEFTAADGWVNDAEQSIPDVNVVATKNGWQMSISTGFELPDGTSIEEFSEPFREVDDPAINVTDPVTFTTTSGLSGVSWELHGPTTATLGWMVADDAGALAYMSADGSASSLDGVEGELTEMAESITIDGSEQ